MSNVTPTPPAHVHPGDAALWRKRWFGTSDYWKFQLLIWGLFCALWITASLLMAPADRDAAYESRQIIRNLLNAAAGITITHLLQILLEALATRTKGWRFRLCATLAVLIASTALVTPGALIVVLTPPYAPGLFLTRWMQAFTAVFMWVSFYFAFVNQRKYQHEQLARARLDVALKDAELRALRSQINPHFLFNSLNSLRAQIPLDLERPRETVTRLADLLRAALGSSEQQTIPLSQELVNVGNYLALEKLRYQPRLLIEQTVAPEAAGWPVPPFLLQSLVENAINHGIAPREVGGTVKINATVRDETLIIAVINPGRIESKAGSTQVGLKNSQARLGLIFGEKASLALAQTGSDEVTATLTLPHTTASSDGPAA